jgi:uncharacterized protein (TIGR02145 family)
MEQTNKVLLAILAVAMITTFGCNKSIKTVTIGSQEWTAENLNVEHYRNGDLIPQVQDEDKWLKLKTGAWCYYENNSENGKTYGKLYNWYAVNDSRGLAPEGWHVPSDAEWTKLTDDLGGITKEGKDDDGSKYWYIESVGGKLKSKLLWNSPNEGATNSTGFTAFPGGGRDPSEGFGGIGELGNFWSASAGSNGNAWFYVLYSDYSVIMCFSFGGKSPGFSVRCVRD